MTLHEAIRIKEHCAAWDVWSCAAESVLIDAFCASGGPIPV